MTSYLITSEQRDEFLKWLELQKDAARIAMEQIVRSHEFYESRISYHQMKARYGALMEVLAYVKTGGKL